MASLEPKAPAEVRNYLLDWSEFLGTDTIATSTVTVVGVTLVSSPTAHTTTDVTVKLSGGTDGDVATVTNTIVTVGGLTESQTWTIQIEEIGEPLSLAEAKAQVRVLDTSEDAYIEALIPAARAYVEKRSCMIIKKRQFIERHEPIYGAIRLYNSPIVSIDEVAYLDGAGAAATYTGARFFGSFVFPALGATWPDVYTSEKFTVTYTAGLSLEQLGSNEYANLLHAMKLLIGHWHSRRSGVSGATDTVPQEVPLAVNDLCDQVRMPVI